MTAPASSTLPVDGLVSGQRGELDISTALIRRFLGIARDELVELTAFVNGRAWICQCVGPDAHIEALRRVDSIRGFAGAYQLVNGPLDLSLGYRYPRNTWQPANNGRATDRDIASRRALFIDVDPVRPKGISASADEQRAAWEVAKTVRDWLGTVIDRAAVGFGCSGNGFYLLVALEPQPNPNDSTLGVSKLLKAIGSKFGTERVKIDGTVANPARLMSAPGTWKRKGVDHAIRPHRLTSFCCSGSINRVRLGDLI